MKHRCIGIIVLLSLLLQGGHAPQPPIVLRGVFSVICLHYRLNCYIMVYMENNSESTKRGCLCETREQ